MYHIIDGDGTLNIGFKSGQITLAHPLDRERTDRLKVSRNRNPTFAESLRDASMSLSCLFF